MSTLQEALAGWLNESKIRLVQNYDRFDRRASGRWARTLDSTIELGTDSITGKITGENYTGVMETGRRRNFNQTPEALRKWVGWAGSTFLKEWVQNKGLSLNSYAVAWKIARLGIAQPEQGKRIISDTFTTEWMKTLATSVGEELVKSKFLKRPE